MNESKMTTFFYGSYMNLNVLKEVDLVPDTVKVARLSGFDIVIRPVANVARSDQHTVYGILASATHGELDRLYAHARDVLGGIYLSSSRHRSLSRRRAHSGPLLHRAEYEASAHRVVQVMVPQVVGVRVFLEERVPSAVIEYFSPRRPRSPTNSALIGSSNWKAPVVVFRP